MTKLNNKIKADLESLVKKYGMEIDTVDINTLYDSSLSYQENKRLIEKFLSNFALDKDFVLSQKQQEVEKEEFERKQSKQEELRTKIELEKEIEKIKINSSPDLNKYFKHAKDYIKTLINAKSVYALIIEGPTAIGKSFITLSTLNELELKNGIDYELLNTYATPLEIYQFFYENNGKLIILDDLMKFFEDELTKGIILSALWNPTGKRIINYQSSTPKLKAPQQFEFTGRVLLLTNRLNEELVAIKSRCFFYHMDFNFEDRIKIIFEICKLNNIPTEIADFIRTNTSPAHDVNFRLPFKINELYQTNQNNGWEKLAVKQLEANEDYLVLQQVLKEHSKMEEAANKFIQLTGLSRRTFFNWKRVFEARTNGS